MDKLEELKDVKQKLEQKKEREEMNAVLREIVNKLQELKSSFENNNDDFSNKIGASFNNLLNKIDLTKSFENLDNTIEELKTGIKETLDTISKKEFELGSPVEIERMQELLDLISEIGYKEQTVNINKPKWYKDFTFDFELLFRGIKTYFDNFLKEIFNVKVKNEKTEPIFVNILDEKGNIIKTFGGSVPLGGGGGGGIDISTLNKEATQLLVKGLIDDIKTNTTGLSLELTQLKHFATSTLGTSTGVNVGNSSTTIIAANAARKGVIIVNNSDTVIFLKLGTGATTNSGIRINDTGGTFVMQGRDVYQGIITGICSSTNKNVTVTELV